MATVGTMLAKFQSVNRDLENIATKVIEETEQELLDFNRKQLFSGEGANQEKLPRYRNNKYARIKNQLNPSAGFGNPDYYVSGRMYREMAIDFVNRRLHIFSTVPYYGDLTARGGDPFGLQPGSKQEYLRQFFKPHFVREIGNRTGVRIG